MKRAVSIVPVKPVTCSGRHLAIGKRAAIDQENIRPTVAVVIEDESSRAHGFRQVLLRTWRHFRV